MGRKSLAEIYFEETSEHIETDNASYFVLYDFRGSKPNSKFWANLRRLVVLVGEGSLDQYSVFMTRSRRGAMTAVRLARHYGAEVIAFKGEEVEL